MDSSKVFLYESDDGNIMALLSLKENIKLNQYPQSCRTLKLTGHAYIVEVLSGHHVRCFDMFKMEQHVFINFCEELKVKGGLKQSRHVSILEKVAIFLNMISHNERVRIMAERFQHSGQTIDKIFHKVLKVVVPLGKSIIVPPNFALTPHEIESNPKLYPYFKACVGAIDGTHINAIVPRRIQIPYQGKRIDTTQNVMCACSFNVLSIFVMAGWEGTTNDSRDFLESVTKSENKFPLLPKGKYYLVDSGYNNMSGFLAPYRGDTYHMQEFRRSCPMPQSPRELFNCRHSCARTVIEWCFGVLKMRFPILKAMPTYNVRVQKYVVIA